MCTGTTGKSHLTEQVNQEGPSWMEGHLTDLAVQRGIEGTGGLLAKPAVGL